MIHTATEWTETLSDDPALAVFRDLLATSTSTDSRAALGAASNNIRERFLAGESVVTLVHARSAVIDALLTHLWQQYAKDCVATAALVAVGGYGRAELHPYSDVDILLLLPKKLSADRKSQLGDFVTALWDVGLEIGHSVRSVEQCRVEAKSDLTVATSLMESRLIGGPIELYDDMRTVIAPNKIWPPTKFFAEKRKEQIERHHRYDDSAYKLEPKVKGSPGGLRDIQVVGWVARRYFDVETFEKLVPHRFLTPGQVQRLNDGQEFLWRVRFGLHVLTGRREDRLLFDHQINLAKMLGYEDATYTLAVEQLMERYYRTVMDLSSLN